MAVCQNLVPLVNINIAGKWMFIPLKMVSIGIDPYPYDISISFMQLGCLTDLSALRNNTEELRASPWTSPWSSLSPPPSFLRTPRCMPSRKNRGGGGDRLLDERPAHNSWAWRRNVWDAAPLKASVSVANLQDPQWVGGEHSTGKRMVLIPHRGPAKFPVPFKKKLAWYEIFPHESCD